MSTLFIAGAGTDIGKTYAACALIRALHAAGAEPDALKPVLSGFDETAVAGSDPALLLEALGRAVDAQTIARMSPWRYAAPLAANMAARAEGKHVDFDAIVAHCRARIAESAGPLLIEGAGGVMSPLSDERTFLDLMSALAAPCVLVAGSYLGALSHALTALEAIRARGLPVRAIVLSESAGSGVDFDETTQTLARLSKPTPVLPLRRNQQSLTDLAEFLLAP